MPDGNTATIVVNLFDGTRQPLTISDRTQLLVRIIDGNQQPVFTDFQTVASLRFKVPFFDNFGDRYTVIASADKFLQAGFTPVNVSPSIVQIVDLMLLPKNGTFNFADATWRQIQQRQPRIASILAHGADDDQAAEDRYEQLMEDKPSSLASLWNLMTAMAGIHLPNGTPLDYFKELIWEDIPDRHLFAPAQDRFYAWVDQNLLEQVKIAARQDEFKAEINPNLFHPGATSSYKEIEFGEANVQLTFHENDTRTIDDVDCIAVEPDIDYFKDAGAHSLLEVIPNLFTGGLSDPKTIYVLRWIAGRHAGVPDFDPPYTIQS
jgi:hypothetical protein